MFLFLSQEIITDITAHTNIYMYSTVFYLLLTEIPNFVPTFDYEQKKDPNPGEENQFAEKFTEKEVFKLRENTCRTVK